MGVWGWHIVNLTGSTPPMLIERPPTRHERAPITPAIFLAIFGATALFALTSRYPGYVHHDTAEIGMWSELGWQLGLPKHPPFLSWLLHAISYVAPLNWVTISVLTAGNIVLGAWAVWRIARLYLDEQRAAIALMLYGLAPGGTFFALKFNHNAALVSLWPLTILAFLLCLRERSPGRSALYGAAFGVMAAIAMLAKYYSGVLLASCVLAALAGSHRDRFLRMPGGYISMLVFVVLVAPHVWWFSTTGADTLAYAFHENEREARSLSHFLMITPLYLIPLLIGYGALSRWLGAGGQGRMAHTEEVADSPLTSKAWVELRVLLIAPFVITVLMIMAFRLRGATSWALPDFCVAGVLCAGLLPPISAAAFDRLKRIAARLLLVLALCGPVVMLVTFGVGESNAVEPRDELARVAGRMFEAGAGRPVRIVAGDPHSSNAAALDLPSRPTVYIEDGHAPWVSAEMLARDGFLFICNTSYRGCQDRAGAVTAKHPWFACSVQVQRRLLWMTGPLVTGEVRVVLPAGVAIDRARAQAACQAGDPHATVAGLSLP